MKLSMRLYAAALSLALGACATMNNQESQSHMVRGASLERLGHLEEAVSQYRQAVAADTSYQPAHFALAVSLFDLYQKQLAEGAVREFQKASSLAPQDALSHYALAVALADYGLKEEALDQYHEALRLDPKFKTTYLKDALAARAMAYKEPPSSLGDLLLRQWDNPVTSQAASASRQETAQKQVEYGNMLGGSGNLQKAMDEYRRASQSDPAFADAFYSLGMADKDAGKNTQAATLLQQYIDMESAQKYPDKDRIKKAQTALDEVNALK